MSKSTPAALKRVALLRAELFIHLRGVTFQETVILILPWELQIIQALGAITSATFTRITFHHSLSLPMLSNISIHSYS
jgi:hypothetical protein